MNMIVLVASGAGFIGVNLARHFVAEGQSVRSPADLCTGLAANLADSLVEVMFGSGTNRSQISTALSSVGAVVRLLGSGSVLHSIENPIATNHVNSTGRANGQGTTRAKRAHAILSSTSSVDGANTARLKGEEMWAQPLSPYEARGMTAESCVLSWREVC